jgi:glycosyltransferase involved in cell wall biosynthesis
MLPATFQYRVGLRTPVLEATACGIPVITLNNTAFPETAAGVAHLLENAEISTLKRGIDMVLSDPVLGERMSKDGPRRAAEYDWRLVTKRYLDLMIPLVRGSGPTADGGEQVAPSRNDWLSKVDKQS